MNQKQLTLFDFKPFNNKCRGWASFYFQEDECNISIDQTEPKQFSVWLQIGKNPTKGRIAENLNEAIEIANKMYLHYLNPNDQK